MNRIVTCTIMLLASCSMLSAQLAGTWATKTPMPTARDAVGSGVVNGIIYAVGGLGGTPNTVSGAGGTYLGDGRGL